MHGGEHLTRKPKPQARHEEREQCAEQDDLPGNVIGTFLIAVPDRPGNHPLGAEAGPHDKHDEDLADRLVGDDHGGHRVGAETADKLQVADLKDDATKQTRSEHGHGQHKERAIETPLRVVAIANSFQPPRLGLAVR